MRWALALSMVAIVAFGLAALWLAQPGRRGRAMRGCSALFMLAVVSTLAVSFEQRSPADARVSTKSVHAASLALVLEAVQASNRLVQVPVKISPPVAVAATRPLSNWGAPPEACEAQFTQTSVGRCVFGDTASSKTIVIYCDSHMEMWFDALNADAQRDRWKLVVLTKGDCPASPIASHQSGGHLTPFVQCAQWHTWAIARINQLRPDLLVVSQDVYQRPDGRRYSPAQWGRGLKRLLDETHPKRSVVLGNIPPSYGPGCLLRHGVRACSTRRISAYAPYDSAEGRAARSASTAYINVIPWFCATRCSPVVNDLDVYHDPTHVAVGYTLYLEVVLGQALGI